MNRQNFKLVLFFIIGMLSAFLVMYLFENYKIEKKPQPENQENVVVKQQTRNESFNDNQERNSSTQSGDIDNLTEENLVIDYVKANRKLPDYYITKGEARSQGWVASKGNLCDVLPGRAIGGDKFSNREKTLPTGAQYFEADVNYNCGRRNADRIVFTKNGDVWLTHDHYKSFQKQ
ncbi:ribonuclease domain-containing protein [Chryseobacterium sp. VAUSW3]|uniref:ribonuclease domain-containing protein n=1 Tax=Chryseobacterium sp. VAUSW3 TaxID=2010998 RepID=UPI000B4C4A0A|nr:ribonuclease domain-containing protein [Chryseobacterium sp. VAUSW3]OWR12966.1 ribonuclease N [Chryseobacterium sp. VAUSW3]